MQKTSLNLLQKIATVFMVAFFFSCENSIKEVQDFLADKNLPIGVAKDIHLIHTDSGNIKTRLITPELKDYANREAHPYQEFPKGIQVTNYEKNGDSVTITANYARTFSKTSISEVKGNVVIINHSENAKLYTEQLFWDQKIHYLYTEKKFTLITKTDTIYGRGFESNEDLTKANMKNVSGAVYVAESIKP